MLVWLQKIMAFLVTLLTGTEADMPAWMLKIITG